MREQLLKHALAYATRGWPVVPLYWPTSIAPQVCCACGSSSCRVGKHPIGRLVPHGLKDASLDAARITAWWTAAPLANVGIVLGEAARMFALDIDPRNGGDRTLAELIAAGLPDTLHAFTGGGGEHFFFAWPGRRVACSAGALGPGVDVKGDGGYIVAPPSLHASGQRYAWDLFEAVPVAAPRWLLDRVAPRPASPPRVATASPPRFTRSGDVRARASAYLAKMPPAISGEGGHRVALRAAIALVRGFDLPPQVALDLLARDFNPRCDPPWSLAELEHKISSAIRASRVGAPGYLLVAKSGA
ncbi:MAG: bifunctional DNA primase/polymerase [Byssovorax sp.]